MAKVHDINQARDARATDRKNKAHDTASAAVSSSKKAVSNALSGSVKHIVIYLLGLGIKLCAFASVLAGYAVYLCVFSGALSMLVLFSSGTQTTEKFLVQLLVPVAMFLLKIFLKKSTYWIARFRHAQATKFGMVLKG